MQGLPIRPRGYRIGVVLTLIALVPLVGAAWFATRAVLDARTERQQVSVAQTAVQDLVDLSELRTQLLDERNWVSVTYGLEDLGVAPEVVTSLTSIDIDAQVVASSSRVDGLVAKQDLTEIAEELSRIRSNTLPNTEVDEGYVALEARTAALANERLDDVVASISLVNDRGDLASALQVLEATTIARRSATVEFNYYFTAKFTTAAERGDALTSLVIEDALRQRALAEIARVAPVGSASAEVVTKIDASDDATAFDNDVTTLIAESIVGQSSQDPVSVEVLADLQSLTNTFEVSTATTKLYLDLVDAASEDVSAASRSAADAAKVRNRQALFALAGLALLSTLFAIGATRAIARPIQRLAGAARRIRDGQLDEPMATEVGPIEVREAARALNEARVHLQLAERQALALAEGDLNHDSLKEPGVGSLGTSLQEAVATLATSMQEREEFRRRMTHEATHDGLTQLPNRNASLDQLQRGLARIGRGGATLAVLYIDLDGFKAINDQHGHHAGDVVLRATAQRLNSSVREGDHVGRLGGDEFVVIAEPVNDEREAVELGQRLREVLTSPIQIDHTMVTIGASIGIALSGPDSHSPDRLLRDADLAVYKAKDLGRNRIEVCDDALRSAAAELADLEQAIHHAIENDEFVLHYQPIIDPVSESTVGYEALIRWNRPGLANLSPDDFIPFAERSELIVAIDQWVIARVAKQIEEWDRFGPEPGATVSINVSGRHLSTPEFVANISGPLREHGIDPARIIIELTETAVLHDLTNAAIKLQQLRQLGVRIAIDDFGTGYTSLAHLRSLPIDILKIDRSFTSDLAAESLVQLIIDTGHLLGATVTAEGIETREQAIRLQRMGTDELQGYLFGRPKPPTELARPADRAATSE